MHSGEFVLQFRKVTPSAARPSRFGVRTTGFPTQPSASPRCWSEKTRTMLGLSGTVRSSQVNGGNRNPSGFRAMWRLPVQARATWSSDGQRGSASDRRAVGDGLVPSRSHGNDNVRRGRGQAPTLRGPRPGTFRRGRACPVPSKPAVACGAGGGAPLGHDSPAPTTLLKCTDGNRSRTLGACNKNFTVVATKQSYILSTISSVHCAYRVLYR